MFESWYVALPSSRLPGLFKECLRDQFGPPQGGGAGGGSRV